MASLATAQEPHWICCQWQPRSHAGWPQKRWHSPRKAQGLHQSQGWLLVSPRTIVQPVVEQPYRIVLHSRPSSSTTLGKPKGCVKSHGGFQTTMGSILDLGMAAKESGHCWANKRVGEDGLPTPRKSCRPSTCCFQIVIQKLNTFQLSFRKIISH